MNMKRNKLKLHTTNEISQKLGMVLLVLNLRVCLKKCLDCIQVSCWLAPGTNIIKEERQVQTPLILDDHIVKNHTIGHDVFEGFHIPKTRSYLELLQIYLAKPRNLSRCLFGLPLVPLQIQPQLGRLVF